MEQQVDKSHYRFDHYAHEDRFVSYYWQLLKVLSREPKNVLEVGVGDGVFGNFVRDNTPVSYTSLDIAPDLKPNIVGSVTELPLQNSSYDITCAFEVLEHIPFDEFETAVSEMCRVARKFVIISLPHFGPMISFSFKFPFIPQVRMSFKIPYPRKHTFNGEHYWEIGKKGYPFKRIRSILEKHGSLEEDFIPFNSPYHHFIVLKLS